MNIEYMKLNDNNYIVTNDDGEIVITKSNDNIKEILMKENEIEDINNTLTKNNKLLQEIKHKEKTRKIMNIFIAIGGIFMIWSNFPSSFNYFNIIKVLVPIFYALLIMKGLTLGIYGIKIFNKRKIKNINSSIKTDLQKVEILTKELEELKTNSNYQVLSYSKTNIKPMIQPNNEYKQKKILTRNK